MAIFRGQRASNRSRIVAIGVEAPFALEALARLFTDPEIIDDGTAEGRLRVVLQATERRRAPGLHTALPFGMSGFRAEFEDPWESSKNQVGHFLTAVRLSFDDRFLSLPIYSLLLGGFRDSNKALRLIIGHEKAPDPIEPTRLHPMNVIQAIRCFRIQYRSATPADVDNFRAGRLEAIDVGEGLGNSLADLRLSYQGWIFGQMASAGGFESKEAMAAWIRRELGETG